MLMGISYKHSAHQSQSDNGRQSRDLLAAEPEPRIVCPFSRNKVVLQE